MTHMLYGLKKHQVFNVKQPSFTNRYGISLFTDGYNEGKFQGVNPSGC